MIEDTREWIGVDLDGTLAYATSTWHCDVCIGDPVPAMLERVKNWLAEGERVKIMTARVGILMQRSPVSGRVGDQAFVDEQRRAIQEWTERHLGVRLEVTATKDYLMKQLWDDRAIQVVYNMGQGVEYYWKSAFRDIFQSITEKNL